jgi:hypothetical protein
MKSLNSALLNCTNEKVWIEQTKISFGPPSGEQRSRAREKSAAARRLIQTHRGRGWWRSSARANSACCRGSSPATAAPGCRAVAPTATRARIKRRQRDLATPTPAGHAAVKMERADCGEVTPASRQAAAVAAFETSRCRAWMVGEHSEKAPGGATSEPTGPHAPCVRRGGVKRGSHLLNGSPSTCFHPSRAADASVMLREHG